MLDIILNCYVLFALVYALISLFAQTRYIKALEEESENNSKIFIESIKELTKKIQG